MIMVHSSGWIWASTIDGFIVWDCYLPPHRTARFEYDDRNRKVRASQKVLNAMRKVEAWINAQNRRWVWHRCCLRTKVGIGEEMVVPQISPKVIGKPSVEGVHRLFHHSIDIKSWCWMVGVRKHTHTQVTWYIMVVFVRAHQAVQENHGSLLASGRFWCHQQAVFNQSVSIPSINESSATQLSSCTSSLLDPSSVLLARWV